MPLHTLSQTPPKSSFDLTDSCQTLPTINIVSASPSFISTLTTETTTSAKMKNNQSFTSNSQQSQPSSSSTYNNSILSFANQQNQLAVENFMEKPLFEVTDLRTTSNAHSTANLIQTIQTYFRLLNTSF
ncbi:unnamed protein product, partial [Didymodactylos carnosus]